MNPDPAPPLVDAFGRQIRYLRLSVTDRCNLRCAYCRPAGVNDEQDQECLDQAETLRLTGIFTRLGVQRVRLTGGEPLTRTDIVDLARQLALLPGLQELSLSTNAIHLDRLAQPLRQAGVARVNISLDSLDPAIFARITRGGRLDKVLAGIDAALQAGLRPVKVNMVVMKGINHHEIPAMVDYALATGVVLRFIETMPVGESGETTLAHFMPAEEILEVLQHHLAADMEPLESVHPGAGPARYYRPGNKGVDIGVISALSQHFCDTCNRMRLTSRGTLVLCLGRQDREELRHPLRQGASDDDLAAIIRQAVQRKPRRHHFDNTREVPTLRMFTLGG